MSESIHIVHQPLETTFESNTAFVLPFFFSFLNDGNLTYQIALHKNGKEISKVNYIKIKKTYAASINSIPLLNVNEFYTGETALLINPEFEGPQIFEIVFNLGNKLIKKIPIGEININNLSTKGSFLAETIIVLPSFNPVEELFKNQIKSIYNQSYSNWHLLIQDDASENYPWIKEFLNSLDSTKFSLFKNDKNLGFYNNVEILFKKAFGRSKYIALSDQDDNWYPEKINALIKNIKPDHTIYSDMKITSENGEIISKSFWKNRSNHFTNPDALLLSNTMTGGASLFHNNQLSQILPFPINIGKSFHDHWIALISQRNNCLQYLDEVLQDYLQHDNNVTGYKSFEDGSTINAMMSVLSMHKILFKQKLFSNSDQYEKVFQDYLKVYYNAFLKRKYYALNLEARMGDKAFQYYLKNNLAKNKLLQLSLNKRKKILTNNIETAMYNSLLFIKSIEKHEN